MSIEHPCINLREKFGRRFRITFDPAYDPKGRPRDKLDPWYMLIPCRAGHTIGPQGGDELRIELEGRHPRIAKRLVGVGCREVRDGDDGHTLLFHVGLFDTVARILNPRKRRRVVLTLEQKALLADRGRAALERLHASRSSEASNAAEATLPNR